jgi:hypothetical protein
MKEKNMFGTAKKIEVCNFIQNKNPSRFLEQDGFLLLFAL